MENGQEMQETPQVAPQDSQEPEGSKPQVVVSKPVHKHWATWLLTVLLVLSLAGSSFLWTRLQAVQKDNNQLKQEKQQLEQQVDQLKAADADRKKQSAGGSELSACSYKPSEVLKENIKAALDSKNTAAFASYVSSPVKYVLAGSEYGGERTPDEAVAALEYTHSAEGPWNFDLPQTTIDEYDSGDYASYFDVNTLVGRATSGMVIAFEFNCDGSKIDSIFVAPSEELL